MYVKKIVFLLSVSLIISVFSLPQQQHQQPREKRSIPIRLLNKSSNNKLGGFIAASMIYTSGHFKSIMNSLLNKVVGKSNPVSINKNSSVNITTTTTTTTTIAPRQFSHTKREKPMFTALSKVLIDNTNNNNNNNENGNSMSKYRI